MKRTYLLVLISFLTGELLAQSNGPVLKIYAYSRQSTAGAAPNVIIKEKGGTAKKAGPVLNESMQLFAEIKKEATIKPVRLWINGKPFAVKNEVIAITPFLFKRPTIGNNFETDSLVPKTNNTVWQLVPFGADKTVKTTPAFASSNKVVFEYSWNGKPYNYTVKEAKKLPPLILQ